MSKSNALRRLKRERTQRYWEHRIYRAINYGEVSPGFWTRLDRLNAKQIHRVAVKP
jgi:hypothetical protein